MLESIVIASLESGSTNQEIASLRRVALLISGTLLSLSQGCKIDVDSDVLDLDKQAMVLVN